MKYATIAINPTINDLNGQLNIIRRSIDEAKKKAIDILAFPELALMPIGAQDLFFRDDLITAAEQILYQITPMTKGITVVIGTPLLHEGHLYNVAAIYHDGAIIAFVPKRYKTGFSEEHRWFDSWDFNKSELHGGATIGAFHSKVIENLDICVGDITNHPVQNKSICIELNNKPFVMNGFRDDLKQQIELSAKHKMTIIRSNLLGCPDGTTIYDGGGIILGNGRIISLSPRFVFDKDFVVNTSDDIPPETFDPTLAHHVLAGSCPNTEDDYAFIEVELALCLGLNDYLKKAHISKLCLALSGGRDSAIIAVLIGRMVALKYPKSTAEERRNLMHDLLVTAYLPSQLSSSSGTQDAALALAAFYGFDCPVIPIGELAARTIMTIEKEIGRKLTWENDDLTLQNVQARTRSTIIWTMANANDALLLTTGNMSEAAVGYATMDGDSSGCLDPIGNLPKTFVSGWLEWACRFHDIPALKLVFAQPPSAELRPLEQKQADEVDLMPYPVLDAFIDWFIFHQFSPRQCLQLAKTHLADFYHSDEAIQHDLDRFIKLATRAQWKRVRFANSFKVMPFDMAPNSGLRWPCLQNAFFEF